MCTYTYTYLHAEDDMSTCCAGTSKLVKWHRCVHAVMYACACTSVCTCVQHMHDSMSTCTCAHMHAHICILATSSFIGSCSEANYLIMVSEYAPWHGHSAYTHSSLHRHGIMKDNVGPKPTYKLQE